MASNYVSTEKLLYYHAGLKNLFATKSDLSDLEDVVDGKVNPATTLAGYGITDAYTKTEVDTALNGKVSVVSGKGLSTNDYTTTEKNKLSGIASGAEVNQNAFSNVTVGSTTIEADGKTDTLTLEAGSNITLTPDATNDKVTIAATDTTYSEATTSVAGLMSTAMVTKLNGVATGAEVNQNAFSNVKVGTSTIAADSKTDTLTLEAGSNVTLTPDTSGDKVTIAATDTTYSDATTTSSGLMSTAMVTKLNGIAEGAEVNQNAFGNVAVGDTTIAADGKTDTLTFEAGSNVTLTANATSDTVTITATDTTYSDATTSAHGLMTAAMVTKLNGIATGAEVNQNAFSNITVGSTTIQADSETDTLTLVAGSNVTLTPDSTNDKVTIEATDTTYSDATTSAHGLMTAEMVTKLNGVATGAEVNVQSDWSVTSSSSDAYIKNKPTTISGYGITDAYTKTQTDSAIATAIAGVTQISFEIVQTLPSTGTNGTIYLVSNSGTAPNTYDEYIYVNNAWEKIGTTAVDLSGYWAKADLVEATNAQIDTILAS